MNNTVAPTPTPRRGEIWLVDLTGGTGAEQTKVRPAIVISSDSVRGGLPLKVLVPLTTWNESFRGKVWHKQILPSRLNGLDNSSSADAMQVRSVAVARFQRKLGMLSATELQDVVAAVAIVLEYK